MEERNYIVYKHTNKLNGKIYIGITKQDVNNRWGSNGVGYRSSVHFYSAIKKYGWNNFEHKIIAKDLTREEANKMEIELIARYDSTNKNIGYNISHGGDGNTGHKLSCGQKLKISYYTRKGLEGKTPYNLGVPMSQEIKDKISKSRKGKCCGSDNHNYGKPLSKETKEKLSKARKQYAITHESPLKGKKLSMEQRQKMSESRKGKYMGKDNACSKSVLQIDLQTKEVVAEFNGVHEAARMTGAIASKISACCVGRRHKHFGYGWVHKDKYSKQKDAS